MTTSFVQPAAPDDGDAGAQPRPGGPFPAPPQPRAGGRAGLVRNVRVGRQGIYDVHRELVAYQLLFRSAEGGGAGSEAGTTGDAAGERATSQVIASTFGTFGLENIADGRPVFLNFTRAFLTGIIPIPVDPEQVVVEVIEDVIADQELLIGLAQLRQLGYRIAVSDYRGDLDRGALLELADYVKVDAASTPTLMLPGLAEQIREYGATMVATGIEDPETRQRYADHGFSLFQGAYLQRPMVLERRTLSPSHLICIRLLNDLSDPETPIDRIEHLVGSDPGLTLRLLRTANSAAGGTTRTVSSLRQALVIIGPRKLRSWVVLTLMGGGAGATTDDLWSVLARAYACERLAGAESELGFTIGLLDGAAGLLGVDGVAVADGAGVGPETRRALIEHDGPAGRALAAVLAHERDDVDGIAATGLLPFDVSRAYLESLSESLTLVHELSH